MRSYQVTEYGKPLSVHESDAPVPQGTEVLVEVKACGVCHSDLHYWQGGYELGGGKRFTLKERGVNLPIVLGHEPVGKVVGAGPDADIEIGTTRLVFPWIGCGDCSRCQAGRDIDCLRMQTIGLFQPGGYASHVLVPHPRYLLDVTGISDSHACTLACAGVTSLSALKKVSLPYEDDSLVMIGAGGVGLTALGMARTIFKHPIVMVDQDEAKLEAATRTGATHVVKAEEHDTLRKVLKVTGGSAGTVIDFVGSPQTAQLGLDVTRRGGRYLLIGLYGGSLEIPLAMVPLRNIAIVGSLTGTVEETQEVIDLVRGSEVTPVPVTTRPLDEATQALEDLRDGKVVGRTVLVP
jgi:D-arabinose 1-dehydrogenase-like Zn-dependent alcohol dehydrogenase